MSNMEDKLDKILNVQTTIQVDIAKIQKDVEFNTRDLKDHVKRTNLLQDAHERLEDRVEVLETPGKVRTYLKERWKHVSIIIGIVCTVAGLMFKFGMIKF